VFHGTGREVEGPEAVVAVGRHVLHGGGAADLGLDVDVVAGLLGHDAETVVVHVDGISELGQQIRGHSGLLHPVEPHHVEGLGEHFPGVLGEAVGAVAVEPLSAALHPFTAAAAEAAEHGIGAVSAQVVCGALIREGTAVGMIDGKVHRLVQVADGTEPGLLGQKRIVEPQLGDRHLEGFTVEVEVLVFVNTVVGVCESEGGAVNADNVGFVFDLDVAVGAGSEGEGTAAGGNPESIGMVADQGCIPDLQRQGTAVL